MDPPRLRIISTTESEDGVATQFVDPLDLHFVRHLVDLMLEDLGEYTIELEFTTAAGTSTEEVEPDRPDQLLELAGTFEAFLSSSPGYSSLTISVVKTVACVLLLRFVLFEDGDDTESLDKCIQVQRDFLQSSPDHPSSLIDIIHTLGQCLKVRSELGSDVDMTYLDESISWRKEAVRLSLHSEPERRLDFLHALANALWARFETRGPVQDDLDVIVSSWAECIQIEKGDISTMVNLGTALTARYDLQSRSLNDLEDAVTWNRTAYLATQKGHPHYLDAVRAYVLSLLQRAESVDDLDQLIALLREQLDHEEEGSVSHAAALSQLGTCLHFRVAETIKAGSSLELLEEAMGLLLQALKILPAGHDECYVAMSNIAQVYAFQYRIAPDPQTLRNSISYQEKALQGRPPGHPRRGISLFHLAQSLIWEAGATGSRDISQKAVEVIKEAVQLNTREADPVTRRTRLLHGRALCVLGDNTENEEDIAKAIDVLRTLLDPPPARTLDHIAALHTLTAALWSRFHLSHSQSYLNEAIVIYYKILEICDPDSPDLWTFYTNLALFHRVRADKFISPDDRDQAIILYQKARALYPSGHHRHSLSLSEYAIAICQYLRGQPLPEPLHEAISLQREALEADPSNPLRWLMLQQLGESLLETDLTGKDVAPYREACGCFRSALSLCPFQGYTRLHLISLLGRTFCALAIANPTMDMHAEEQESRELYRQATEIASLRPEDPKYRFSVDILATVFFFSQFTLHNNHGDLLNALRSACNVLRNQTVDLPVRLLFADRWLSMTVDRVMAIEDHPRDVFNKHVSEVYDLTMEMLPRLAYLGQDPKSRLHAIRLAPRFTRDAALHAISVGNHERAVEYVEHGRSIFWSQALQLRTPLDELKEKSPALYEQMGGQLKELERESHWDPENRTLETETKISLLHQKANELDTLLEEIRNNVPGLEDFMRPKPFPQLVSTLCRTPVVIIIPADECCYALVIKSSTEPIENITLSGLSAGGVHQLVLSLGRAAKPAVRLAGIKSSTFSRGGGIAGSSFEDILSRIWRTIVKPVIGKLGYKKAKGRERPRIWWCPTGEAAFLPLHAAGVYKGRVECASDFVVSSYTPNLNTLAGSRDLTLPISELKSKVLLLAQPRARGQSRLYNTTKELLRIAELAPPDSLLFLGGSSALDIEGNLTTSENVFAVLPEAFILHMSCHGFQDPNDELNSGFAMLDDRLTIMKLMQVKSPHAFFAFLSACHSASGGKEVPDETVGLASTMLFAGFRTVVGTMWTMADVDGPDIAEAVYKELFGHQVLDPEVIPYALDEAVQALRKKNVGVDRWACHIHVGV